MTTSRATSLDCMQGLMVGFYFYFYFDIKLVFNLNRLFYVKGRNLIFVQPFIKFEHKANSVIGGWLNCILKCHLYIT